MINYTLVGTFMPAVAIKLLPGQSVYASSDRLAWMGSSIRLTQTGKKQGIWGMLKRLFGGTSLFFSRFTAETESELTLSGALPGQILTFDLAPGEELICRRQAFFYAEDSVDFDFFYMGMSKGLFSGQGLFMQRLKGPGRAAIVIDGEVVQKDLTATEMLTVASGHVAAYQPSIQFGVGFLKGISNILFSGEGLFINKISGPGRVWLQTVPAEKTAKNLQSYIGKGTAISLGSGTSFSSFGGSDTSSPSQ